MRRPTVVRYLIAALAGALLFTACGDASPGGGGGPSGQPSEQPSERPSTGEYDGAWVLTGGRGPQGEIPLVDDYPVTLVLDGSSVGGTAACNGYGADAEIDGDRITISGGSHTEMACAPDVMESEAAFLEALQLVTSITSTGGELTIAGPDVELRFERLPPVPTADLVDTDWILESLLQGEGPDGVATSAEPARLRLSSDGTFSGTTPCREFTGEWIEGGGGIQVTAMSAQGSCGPQGRDQDGHVVSVLGDGFTAQIDGRTLILFGRGGQGLQYRAP